MGRRFGFTVGGAFGVLSLFLHFVRNAVVVPRIFGVLAVLLLTAALVAPTRLGPVESAWMRLAHLISKVTTPIFMGLVYFLVVTPFGLARRMLGKNALVRTPGSPGLAPDSYWTVRETGKTRSDLERQF